MDITVIYMINEFECASSNKNISFSIIYNDLTFCKILILIEPVEFDTPARNITARRGESVTLNCDVRGDHPIQVYWLFNDQRIHHSNYR